MPKNKTKAPNPKKSSKKSVYFFGDGKAEGTGEMKDILGGKGAGLAEMTNIGIPVPSGFTISTDVCVQFYKNSKKIPQKTLDEIDQNTKALENITGKKLGDKVNPLLVSVRSGAKFSMPGMMDTILNLGLNDSCVEGISKATANPRFAWDSYRRFIQMFSGVVLNIGKHEFELILDKVKESKGITQDIDLNMDDFEEIVKKFKELVIKKTGRKFPQDPQKQLMLAINAVFLSWQNPRAVFYRKQYDIPHDIGTAVNVQAMVFGNMGDDSGSGVGFSRDPASGEKKLFAEYLLNAQGEDVVAGSRTPKLIEEMQGELPETYTQLVYTANILERHFRDMQDFEFTIEQGTLYLLQTRSGKRTGIAAAKIAYDMVKEGRISEQEALLRLEPEQLEQFLFPIFDPEEKKSFEVVTIGLAASPGAAAGRVVFDSESAIKMKDKGERSILVRRETSPDDIHGMAAARGVLTARGGRTSHAAVVGRQMGKVCVVGAGEMKFIENSNSFKVGKTIIKEGDYISIDGFEGNVYQGDIPVIPSEVIQVMRGSLRPEQSSTFEIFSTILRWADKAKKLKIRTNADTPLDSELAVRFGAEGIGLCRTEHMFFEEDRIQLMQGMILAETPEERVEFLNKLQPLQKADFKGIFRAMDGFPVTIRLLDPPLHEFLPSRTELILEIRELELTVGSKQEIEEKKKLLRRVEELREVNPMLGFRGCRLGNIIPDITRMQTRAILEAACEVAANGVKVIPEIMVPLVGMLNEFKAQKNIIEAIAKDVFKRYKKKVNFFIGTMIEVPRAAVVADEIATEAEFFSFGTNDLTQTVFAFSRDDAGKFIKPYMEMKVTYGDKEVEILEKDPFLTLDIKGVGAFIKMAYENGKSTRPDLKVGICGEHGGDPASIEFCHKLGLDYVSCSPFRVPIARLAAARAAIMENS